MYNIESERNALRADPLRRILRERKPHGGRPIMTRSQEREKVFRILFASEFHPERTAEELCAEECAAWEIPDSSYIRDTVLGALGAREETDALISGYARKWKLSRMSAVTRTLLRLAVYEMLLGGIPARAAINEALELAKLYDDEAARSFINGILHQLAQAKGLLLPPVTSEETE